MSQKSIASVILLIATALGTPVAVDHAISTTNADQVSITGPDTCVVGELVELSINGSRTSWLPPTDDHVVIDNKIIVCFRENGTYEVIGSAVSGGKTRVVRHTVTVGSPTVSSTLSSKVEAWCEGAPKATCEELGNNFLAAANSVDTGLEVLLRNIATRNREVDQTGCEELLATIQQYLFENLRGEDFETHRAAFIEIGNGLLAYSKR